jgi:hypothetical protein
LNFLLPKTTGSKEILKLFKIIRLTLKITNQVYKLGLTNPIFMNKKKTLLIIENPIKKIVNMMITENKMRKISTKKLIEITLRETDQKILIGILKRKEAGVGLAKGIKRGLMNLKNHFLILAISLKNLWIRIETPNKEI